ncbi:MAG: prolipoprotein diacylglyceryl transferase [FCB group bacterium]|jgi:phosphatidylglycerol:prolipoprotein diacylglycerol transferase|nr:prolipoprotein diacylglyceryl transferase [FCB group bacterium]
MRPELFNILGVPFHAYRTLLALAFLVCTLLAVRESQRRDEGFVLPPQAGAWGLIGALLGAKLFWALQYAPMREWWRALLLWEGGLVFYGGLIGGVLVLWLYLRRLHIPFLPAGDIMAPYLALGEAITRVGCFLNGCCWGAVSGLPWTVSFPPGCAAYSAHVEEGLIQPGDPHTLPVHPTQLYMVGGLLIAFLLLKALLARKSFRGHVMIGYLFLYGVARFTVEVFRGDSGKPVLGMTVSQLISFGLVVAAIVAWVWHRQRAKQMTQDK